MRKSHPLLQNIEAVRPYRLTKSESMYGIQPPSMQIDGFLASGSVMGITAYPGVGKTWLTMEICRAVSEGEKFLGRFPAVRGGVLFVGSDSSLEDYARQWTRLTQHRAGDYDAARFLIQSTFMFEDRDEIRRLIRTHQSFVWGDPDEGTGERETGFSVVVFDTVSRLTRANQNDNTEMEEVFRNIRLFAEATGCAVILLHHNSKKSEFSDGSDWRGAMSQIGALDSWVHLVPHATKKHLVGVQFKKFRGITPADFAYQMNVDDAKEASLVAVDEAVTRAQRMTGDGVAKAVEAHIKAHPGLRASVIRDAIYDQFKDDFPSKTKFTHAVNNRLNAMMQSETVVRYQSQDGKSLYREATKPDSAGAATQP